MASRNPLEMDANLLFPCGRPPNKDDAKNCLWATFCPCWVWGRNMKLALHQNPWLHGLAYAGVWLFLPVMLIAARIAVDITFARCIYHCKMDAIVKADTITEAATAAVDLDLCDHSCTLPVRDPWLSVVSCIYYAMWASWLLAALYCATMRTALRGVFGAHGSHAKDVALWCCCPLLALWQETRAVHHRYRGDEHKSFVSDIEAQLAPLVEEDAKGMTLPLMAGREDSGGAGAGMLPRSSGSGGGGAVPPKVMFLNREDSDDSGHL